jgi:hypothetical protein
MLAPGRPFQMRFRASVQYNDLRGTSAADNGDDHDLRRLLIARNLMTNEDAVVGIKVFVGENHGGPCTPASIDVLTVPLAEYQRRLEARPLRAKVINLEMPIEDFCALFKRLSIALSSENIDEYEEE